jgi:hypothetical protein
VDWEKEQMRAALLDSIEKWENRAAGKDDFRMCSLCAMYTACQGCPVAKHTGLDDCRGTPYWQYVTEGDTDVRKDLARKEADFLKSLLP